MTGYEKAIADVTKILSEMIDGVEIEKPTAPRDISDINDAYRRGGFDFITDARDLVERLLKEDINDPDKVREVLEKRYSL